MKCRKISKNCTSRKVSRICYKTFVLRDGNNVDNEKILRGPISGVDDPALLCVIAFEYNGRLFCLRKSERPSNCGSVCLRNCGHICVSDLRLPAEVTSSGQQNPLQQVY